MASLRSLAFISLFSQSGALQKNDQSPTSQFQTKQTRGKSPSFYVHLFLVSFIFFPVLSKCFHRFANSYLERIDLVMEQRSLDPSGITQEWPQPTIRYH